VDDNFLEESSRQGQPKGATTKERTLGPQILGPNYFLAFNVFL